MTERASVTRLRASYTVTQLAELLDLTRGQTRRLLERAGVPIDKTGDVWRVWVLDLQRCCPKVWDSITFVQAVNG